MCHSNIKSGRKRANELHGHTRRCEGAQYGHPAPLVRPEIIVSHSCRHPHGGRLAQIHHTLRLECNIKVVASKFVFFSECHSSIKSGRKRANELHGHTRRCEGAQYGHPAPLVLRLSIVVFHSWRQPATHNTLGHNHQTFRLDATHIVCGKRAGTFSVGCNCAAKSGRRPDNELQGQTLWPQQKGHPRSLREVREFGVVSHSCAQPKSHVTLGHNHQSRRVDP